MHVSDPAMGSNSKVDLGRTKTSELFQSPQWRVIIKKKGEQTWKNNMSVSDPVMGSNSKAWEL